MKILFACGGTAGHINPALAIATHIKGRHPEAEILFAGNPKGMEAKLVPKAGYAFTPIEIMGFQRQFNWFNIKYNIRSIGCLMTAGKKAKRILRDFDPDIVIGTGGYVSGPILMHASKLGYRTLAHEQNAFPGVTTKLLAKYVDKLLLAVEKAKDYLRPGIDYTVTGNPIREQIVFEDREACRKLLGVEDRICILSFGGSLGARRINEAVADLIGWSAKQGRFHHIHATGKLGVELMDRLLREKKIAYKQDSHLDIREYIDNMPKCLAAADLVICRAGAITLSELQACGKASVLIPSPNVAENHQFHNAMVLANADAAVVIEEKDLTGEKLCDEVDRLTKHPETLKRLGKNAQKMAIIDANDRIYAEIMQLIKKPKSKKGSK